MKLKAAQNNSANYSSSYHSYNIEDSNLDILLVLIHIELTSWFDDVEWYKTFSGFCLLGSKVKYAAKSWRGSGGKAMFADEGTDVGCLQFVHSF